MNIPCFLIKYFYGYRVLVSNNLKGNQNAKYKVRLKYPWEVHHEVQ